MPANPMQKKAKNAFLLGVLITLVICLIIGGLAFVLISNKNKAKEKEEGTLTYAYRLKRDVKALSEITSADVEAVTVTSKAVPAGSFPSKTLIKNAKGKEEWKDTAFPAGKYAKVALKAGTILGSSLVLDESDSFFEVDKETNEKKILSHVRRVEYNMLVLGTDVDIGDFVDIRITFQNGQDMIVVSKKEVKSLLGNTVGFDMQEGEIELMQSAIVESYIIKTSKLYVTKYVDPGIQEKVAKTYEPTAEVKELMKDSKLVDNAFKGNSGTRDSINNIKNEYLSDLPQNVEDGLQTEIENAQKAREAYLSGLTSY